MKLRVFAALLSISAFAAGCATTRVEPVAVLMRYSSATLLHGKGDARREVKDVSIVELTPILARATWVDKQAISKGGFWIKYPNGSRVFIAAGFDFFRIEGVPGHFEIRSEDVPAYRALADEMGRMLHRSPHVSPSSDEFH